MRKNIARRRCECYPDFSAEHDALAQANGNYESVNLPSMVSRIIRKHRWNAAYNRGLFERYQCLSEGVPIFGRVPRFPEQGNPINNQLNADYFSEIVDFKTGYFAGKPISYSYSDTQESRDSTGSDDAVDAVQKALTDFCMHAGIYDVDMQCVKHAAICGYGARLFYIDKPESDGTGAVENVMPILPYQAVILSCCGDISQPDFAVRYYKVRDIDDAIVCKAEFYDSRQVYYFTGGSFDSIREEKSPELHMFGFCPLQGIPNNAEMIGDAEKVLSLIDDYNKTISDASNEIESSVHSYMVFKNVNIPPEKIAETQRSGSIQYYTGSSDTGDIFFLEKNINDTFLQNHLNRLQDDIYRGSKTPNLTDEAFGNASGVSLKFKLIEHESKCGMLQAKFQAAGMYMFRLLSTSWRNRLHLNAVPEQFVMEFTRNFPLDALSEAQAAQAMIASGLPKRVAFSNAYSFIDDVDYVMDLIAEEDGDTVSLYAPEEPENLSQFQEHSP